MKSGLRCSGIGVGLGPAYVVHNAGQVARNLWVPQAQEAVIERSDHNLTANTVLLLLRNPCCKQQGHPGEDCYAKAK